MIDPITLSVLTHRFESIVREIGEAMLRTAYSQILNSSRDFSTAICDRDTRLVAQAEHVPIHVGAMPWAVASVRDHFVGRVKPGDVFLLNDPYHGGNHLPDLTAFVPVFVDGELGRGRDVVGFDARTVCAQALGLPVTDGELSHACRDHVGRRTVVCHERATAGPGYNRGDLFAHRVGRGLVRIRRTE